MPDHHHNFPQKLDQYTLVEPLKQGGEAWIYKGRNSKGEIVAIRVLGQHEHTETSKRRFEREVKNLRQLQGHPHIIRLNAFGFDQGWAYLVMPYIPGGSVQTWLDSGKKFPFNTILIILQQTAEALSYAHKHDIIHRDVKPANLLCGDNGILLSDFGIALNSQGSTTLTRASAGTPFYQAPEHKLGHRPKASNDQFALAVTGYYLFTGTYPQKDNQQSLLSKFPHLAKVFKRALDADPKDRFPSVADFMTALNQAAHADDTKLAPADDLSFHSDSSSHHVSKNSYQGKRQLKIASLALLVVCFLLGGMLGELEGRWRWVLPHVPPPVATPSTASLIVVTSVNDQGPGSLREAINLAKNGSTITFSSNLIGQIVLLHNPLEIDKGITLQGPGPDQRIVIESSALGRITLTMGSSVTIKDIEFRGTFQNQKQAFLTVQQSPLTVIHCTFSGFETEEDNGSVINSELSTITIQDSHFHGNKSENDGGGAVYTQGGKLHIQNSVFEDNTAKYNGGAIYSIGGMVFLTENSRVSNNRITGDNPDTGGGGGIAIQSGTIIILDSSIEANSITGGALGGGLLLSGTIAVISNASIRRNIANTPGSDITTTTDLDSGLNGSLYIVESTVGHTDKYVSYQIILKEDYAKPDATNQTKYNPVYNPQFLGWLSPQDFSRFCQAIPVKSFSGASIGQDITTIHCIKGEGEKETLKSLNKDVDDICKYTFPDEQNVISRLANYRNPYSWQCYKNEQFLGNITQKNDDGVIPLHLYCQQSGAEAKLTGETAYDWVCQQTQHTSGDRISMAQACQMVFGNHPFALERLTDYYNPESWECWAPLNEDRVPALHP